MIRTFRDLNAAFMPVRDFVLGDGSFTRGDVGILFAALVENMESVMKPMNTVRSKYLKEKGLSEDMIALGSLSEREFVQTNYTRDEYEEARKGALGMIRYVEEALDAELPEEWDAKPFLYADDLNGFSQKLINALVKLGVVFPAGERRKPEDSGK